MINISITKKEKCFFCKGEGWHTGAYPHEKVKCSICDTSGVITETVDITEAIVTFLMLCGLCAIHKWLQAKR